MDIQTVRAVGEALSSGAVDTLGKLALVYFAVKLVLWLCGGIFAIGVDDSDRSAWSRSGLTVHTDHKTGVDYVSDGHGGMMVRIDGDGRPVVRGVGR